MELTSGASLLHYCLVEKIGEGGMGVVWKAQDTTLGRDVAIKVLPDTLAADPERLARFEREARVLASLNHPHIAGIYGIHEAGGRRFLSMELVPGEDLAQMLDRGPLPLERALDIARQVAEALEAAHDNGVVHRDLKPANVRITSGGKAKVLDFGLAKAYDPVTASDPLRSPTITSAGTVAGLILGTAAYMSPEQASGQPTDRRADIWSFGVVLCEMVTGKRLFAGETVSHTLADVLRKPIDLAHLPDETPRSVRRLIERCLDRDRSRRLRDIGEARIAIEDSLAGVAEDAVAGTGTGAGTSTSASALSRLPWIVAAAALLAAIVGLAWPRGGVPPLPEPTLRAALEIPNTGGTRQGDGQAVAISPDGRSVVTIGGYTDQLLFRRDITDFQSHAIEGTAGGRNPFYSPDGEWIGFMTTSDLYKVRSTGGAPIKIATISSVPTGLVWADDGHLYFGTPATLLRVSEDGGEPERVISEEEQGNLRLILPFVVPGSELLLCSTPNAPDTAGRLFAIDLKTRTLKDLKSLGSNPRYLATGHLMYAQGDRVFVAPFDLDTVEITGAPTPVHPRAWVDQGQIQMDIAADGRVVYLPATRGETQALVTVDMRGTVMPLLPDGLPFISLNDPRISPDGRRLFLSVEGGGIWMIDLDTQTPTLMSEAGFYPLWSPDGEELVFSTSRGESYDVYRRPVDLSQPEQLLYDEDNNLRTMDWTAQNLLVIREEIGDKGMDLKVFMDPDDPDSAVPLLEGPDDELAPEVSTDGKWMVYVSDYSGRDEIYVTSFPKAGARIQISTKGGNSPTWAPDGSKIYYFEGPQLMAVSVEPEPRFRVTGRDVLFEGNYVQYRWSRQYDIHPDGDHFILVKNPARGNVEIVTNWFAELRSTGR
jgi:eukaryotic-like serine/threonine-protein kinase